MSHKVIRRTITAVAFAATLTLAGTSEAGAFINMPVPSASEPIEQQSLWNQAWSWMTGFWGDLTGTSVDKTSTGTTSTTTTGTTTTTTCTNPSGCTGDAGWGIDPNG
jgi:hypothetical protein